MPPRSTYPPLNVYLNSRHTGRLRRLTSGAIDFRYDQGWLDWKHAFPVSLSLPLREQAYSGAEVIAVFENLLPDNQTIRRRVAARTQADGTDAYSLLSTIGRDCVGAMQFLPEGNAPGVAGTIDAQRITDARVGRLLSNLRVSPMGIEPDSDFRISIAGAQDKTALLNLNGEWHLPEGSTPTTHILKTQIGQAGDFDMSQSVENEHFCMRILDALGFAVAKTEIVDFDGVRALVVERFDREWTSDGRLLRRPQEDVCQALGVSPSQKYQTDGGPGIVNILEFLKASDDPAADHFEFIKTQIAFWLLGAIDGHAKNFSVFLHSGGGFRLTPLYDVMSVQHLLESGQIQRRQAKLAMSVGGNRHYNLHEILPRHFVQTVAEAGLSQTIAARACKELADALPDAIEQCRYENRAVLPDSLAEGMQVGVDRRLRTIASWLDSL